MSTVGSLVAQAALHRHTIDAAAALLRLARLHPGRAPHLIEQALRELEHATGPVPIPEAHVLAVLQRRGMVIGEPDRPTKDLTETQEHFVRRLVAGQTRREIATAMGVSVSTVTLHQRNVASKWRVAPKAANVAAEAVRRGYG